jgi:uncharacterized membrane protein
MFGVPYHFLVIHFAIVLILVALLYDARGMYEVGYRLTLGAALAAALATTTGLMLAGGKLSEMTVHASAGILGGLAAVVLAALRYSAKAREGDIPERYPAAWLVIEIAAAVAIVIAAFTGHRALLGY